MITTNTSRAYTTQDHLPSHPGTSWTRFVCISDTHSRKFRVPQGDVLLHAGDLSSQGCLEHLETTLQWLKSLDHRVKMFTFNFCYILYVDWNLNSPRIIAGNHDVGYCPTKCCAWKPAHLWFSYVSINSGKQACHLMSVCLIRSFQYSSEEQSVDEARALVRSKSLRDSGIYYLEHESLRFKTPEGREWHVYGSPVSV